MVFIKFSKKLWTIVHGFHQIFEEIIDYSPWFSLTFSKKTMDYSPWFSSLHCIKKWGLLMALWLRGSECSVKGVEWQAMQGVHSLV